LTEYIYIIHPDTLDEFLDLPKATRTKAFNKLKQICTKPSAAISTNKPHLG